MSDLELTDEAPSATAQAGAETRRKALFMLAHNDGLTVTGTERPQLSTMPKGVVLVADIVAQIASEMMEGGKK